MNIVPSWSLEYLLGRWRPTIGDPSFMGWFTAGSYFACAMAALIAILTNQVGGRRSIFFWTMIGLFMIFLGLNKQIDLQPLFTEAGRLIMKAKGWMDQWRISQIWLIVAFGTIALVAFLPIVIIMRGMFRRLLFAFIGIFFILSFIFLRAVSFYHFDEILGFTPSGAKTYLVLELGGIYLILVAGIMEIRANISLKKEKMNLLKRLRV